MTSTDLYKLHTDSQSDSEDDNMTEDDSNVSFVTVLQCLASHSPADMFCLDCHCDVILGVS